MSGFGKAFKLDEMSEDLQRQIRAQSAGRTTATAQNATQQGQNRARAGDPALSRVSVPPDTPKPPRGRKGPNKTEARYEREVLAPQGIIARYEGTTFKLMNGHRYTPDWVFCDSSGRAVCVEVKGPYRFHSHQRARVMFDQAKIEWPAFVWIWVIWTGKEWRTEL